MIADLASLTATATALQRAAQSVADSATVCTREAARLNRPADQYRTADAETPRAVAARCAEHAHVAEHLALGLTHAARALQDFATELSRLTRQWDLLRDRADLLGMELGADGELRPLARHTPPIALVPLLDGLTPEAWVPPQHGGDHDDAAVFELQRDVAHWHLDADAARDFARADLDRALSAWSVA